MNADGSIFRGCRANIRDVTGFVGESFSPLSTPYKLSGAIVETG